MKKTFLLILLFCTQNFVLAQKKLNADDWGKILSGKIETYQAYNVKTYKLNAKNRNLFQQEKSTFIFFRVHRLWRFGNLDDFGSRKY